MPRRKHTHTHTPDDAEEEEVEDERKGHRLERDDVDARYSRLCKLCVCVFGVCVREKEPMMV